MTAGVYAKAGTVFGNSTLLEDARVNRDYVRVRCTCGAIRTVRADALARKGRSGSCTSCSLTKHGLSRHPLYHRWHNMMRRCYDPNDKSYLNYGGREVPIKVCERWSGKDGLVNFIADMEPSFQSGLSLDRKDNDKDYSPGNCWWANPLQQTANRRPHVQNADYEALLRENKELRRRLTRYEGISW